MKLNLLVIRTQYPKLLKEQYEILGLKFEYHQHGKGPFHYASECNGFVFEIYPLTKSMEKSDGSLRLGFDINNLNQTIKKITRSDWIIASEPTDTEYGRVAIIQDCDGRKVELKDLNNGTK